MPGKQYHPLRTSGENSEYERFRAAAKDGGPLDELIGLTLLDTGIRNSAMGHMRKGWINLHGDRPEIMVPLAEKCTIGSGPGQGDTSAVTRGEPCHMCRNRPDSDWHPKEGDWHPKTKNARRVIPIRNEDTKRILRSYFDLNDTVGSSDTIISHTANIAERAGIERRITPHDLRNTFGTQLANKGFGPHKIKDSMGHASIKQAQDYIKLSANDLHNEFDDKW